MDNAQISQPPFTPKIVWGCRTTDALLLMPFLFTIYTGSYDSTPKIRYLFILRLFGCVCITVCSLCVCLCVFESLFSKKNVLYFLNFKRKVNFYKIIILISELLQQKHFFCLWKIFGVFM